MGDENGNGNNDGNGDDGGKTFTQEQLEDIVKKRLERDRRTRGEQYSDYDDLKEAAEELARLKDADLTEQEKLKKRITELKQAEADAKAATEAREAEINEKLLRAEVRVVAATMNFIDPEEAWKLANLSDVTFSDDGKVEGVEKPLKALAKKKPHLLKTVGGPGSPPNKPSGKTSKADEEAQWVAAARERFNIRDYGGKD